MDVLVYERVPYYTEYNDQIFQNRIESISQVDPRISLYLGEGAYALMCWYHRYKMYGPNHAMFMLNYADVFKEMLTFPEHYPNFKIRMIGEWCSNDMVREVLDTSFIFGESNRASIFKDVPDTLGTTSEMIETELYSRFRGIEMVSSISAIKYYFYDPTLFIGFMLNEAERIMREKNDSLIYWSVNKEKFKENGLDIAKVFKEAITSINVVGLKGSYNFDANTLTNSGGFTPISLVQLSTFAKNFSIEQSLVAWYDRSQPIEKRVTIKEELIHWNTPDGKHPFDHVQIRRLAANNLIWSSVIPLMVISFLVCLSLMIVSLKNKKNRTFSNFFLVLGVLLCNCHVYLMYLRNIEPIAFHCSILAGLIMVGTGTIILANWSILNHQYQAKLNTLIGLEYSSIGLRSPLAAKTKISTLQKVFIVAMFLILMTLGILFIFTSAINSFNIQATFGNTFGKREIILSTVKYCKLNLETFPIIILTIYLTIVILLALCTSFLAFSIRVCKKQMKKLRKSISKRRLGKDGGNFFIVCSTVIVCSFVILVLLPEQDFIITAVMVIFLGLNATFMVHFM